MIDMAAVTAIIAEVAATEIMPRFKRLRDGDVIMKGVDDPVTVADRAAEAALTTRLTDYLPDSVVVGEEGFAADPAILSRFEGTAPVWIVDPIDGTRNFIGGKREFAVMVALWAKGEVIASWIHDPHTGDTLMSQKGDGVWLDGLRVTLAGRGTQPPLGIIGSRLVKNLAARNVEDVLARLPQIVPGSAAAFDYARLFAGPRYFADSEAGRAAWLIYRNAKPWDHMPGLFMHREAGGYAADFLGRPYRPTRPRSGLLVAPDKDAWQAFMDVLRPAVAYLIEKADA